MKRRGKLETIIVFDFLNIFLNNLNLIVISRIGDALFNKKNHLKNIANIFQHLSNFKIIRTELYKN